MAMAAFDPLEYFDRLKSAGMPEDLARVQAEAMRQCAAGQEEAIRRITREQEEKNSRELATKSDLRETELRLQKEMKDIETRLIKWQLGIGFAILAIMARGFGWLGF